MNLPETHCLNRWPESYFASYSLPVLLAVALGYLTWIFQPSSDCVYFAMQFRFDGADPTEPVSNLRDLITSISAHYMTWSGRFVCQLIASAFCAFATQQVFAVCNSLVFLVFITLAAKCAGIGKGKGNKKGEEKNTWWCKIWFLGLAGYLVVLTLPFDPPFLVNYLWMGTLTLGWLLCFTKVKEDAWRCSQVQYTLLFLFSVIAGNAQESFSLPLAGALAMWIWLKARREMTPALWVMVAGYWTGALLLTVAPGNFVRMEESAHPGMMATLQNAWPVCGCILLLVLAGAGGIIKGGFRVRKRGPMASLCLEAIFITLSLIIALKGDSAERILVATSFFLMPVAVQGAWPRLKTGLLLFVCLFASVAASIYEGRLFGANTMWYLVMEEGYAASPDGCVCLPDSIFIHQTGRNNYYLRGFEVARRAVEPGKPDFKPMPESLCAHKDEIKPGFILQIASQAWIYAQSVENPQPLIIERTITAGLFRKRIPDRKVLLADFPKNIIDTVGDAVVGYYINSKPYMEATPAGF